MVYVIQKKSDWWINCPYKYWGARPDYSDIEGAFQQEMEIWREAEKVYYDHCMDEWYSKGSKHTVTEDGKLRRLDAVEQMWCINIESIEQLMDLRAKYGDLIIIGAMWTDTPVLVIVDNGWGWD